MAVRVLVPERLKEQVTSRACTIACVRLAYFDESGITEPEKEPVTVVAGVLVDADLEWQRLRQHFSGLVQRFAPPERRDGFVFHAMDVWHGKGVFDRKTWTGDRHEIIDALCKTIIEFKLPVVFGHCVKTKVTEAVPEIVSSKGEINRVAFMTAFADCALGAERWMREWAPAQVAVLIAENNNDLRRHAKVVHQIFSGKSIPPFLLERVKELPFTHLIDTVYYADKRDAPPLQLADLVAFLFRRCLSSKDGDKVALNHLLKIAPLCPQLMQVLERMVEQRESSGAEGK